MESENLIFIFFYSCTKFEGREMDMQLNLNLPSYKNSCSAFNENLSLFHGNSISFSLIFLILISLSNNPSNATTLHISHTLSSSSSSSAAKAWLYLPQTKALPAVKTLLFKPYWLLTFTIPSTVCQRGI